MPQALRAAAPRRPKIRAFPFTTSLLSLFAFLLAIVSWRHAMFEDELQAWIIARNSHSLPALFHNLRYEGHPALWYLLVFACTWISWNPVLMQALNYLLAIGEAGLILSAERVPRWIRGLLVFSLFVFYYYGVVARSYMLAILLLTAAARCLTGSPRRPFLGLFSLFLAINTHFFAIPIATALFAVLFCFPDPGSWKHPIRLLRQRRFWAASAFLLLGLALAYFTIRPPADFYNESYYADRLSPLTSFWICLGRVWQVFLPLPASLLHAMHLGAILPSHQPSLAAALISLSLLLLIASSLRTAQARGFFLWSCVLELTAFSLTVHVPILHHEGFIFEALIIALIIDAYPAVDRPEKKWLARKSATAVMLALLAVQILISAQASLLEMVRPFSQARDAGLWIRRSEFHANPLVIDPDSLGPGILAYAERDQAYYPQCECFGSFVIWNSQRARNKLRTVTSQELNNLYRASGVPAVLVESRNLGDDESKALGVRLVKSFERPAFMGEKYFIYTQVAQ